MKDEHNAVFTFRDEYYRKEYHLDLKDIMLMTNVFEHVLQKFAKNEGSDFICNLLDFHMNKFLFSEHALQACKTYTLCSIMQDGHYSATFSEWLHRNGCPEPTAEISRQARMLWVTQTICRFTQILKDHHYPF